MSAPVGGGGHDVAGGHGAHATHVGGGVVNVWTTGCNRCDGFLFFFFLFSFLFLTWDLLRMSSVFTTTVPRGEMHPLCFDAPNDDDGQKKFALLAMEIQFSSNLFFFFWGLLTTSRVGPCTLQEDSFCAKKRKQVTFTHPPPPSPPGEFSFHFPLSSRFSLLASRLMMYVKKRQKNASKCSSDSSFPPTPRLAKVYITALLLAS